MKMMALIFAFLYSPSAVAQERAVPVEQEPFHKMVFKNDYVEVIHVTLPPGEKTLLHTHSHDAAAIGLSESIVGSDSPGKESTQASAHPGDVLTKAYEKQHFTHRVNNLGKTAFEVLDIELLKRPDGARNDPIAAPAAENDSLRVYKWTLDPGGSAPMHTHTRPYLIVAATPMQLVMKAPDGGSMEHPINAGDFHWIDSRVTHTLINSGKKSGIIIEVELR